MVLLRVENPCLAKRVRNQWRVISEISISCSVRTCSTCNIVNINKSTKAKCFSSGSAFEFTLDPDPPLLYPSIRSAIILPLDPDSQPLCPL